MRLARLLPAALAFCSAAATPARRSYSTHAYYALEIDPNAGASLDDCAAALGVEVVERVGELADQWLVRRVHTPVERREYVEDPVLRTLDQLRSRSSTSASRFRSRSVRNLERRVGDAVKHLSRQEPRQRIKRDGAALSKRAQPPLSAVRNTLNGSSVREVSARFGIHDPEFLHQWHLVDEDYPEHSMNVTGLWEMGITGQGVISALVDDGLDYNSDDLKDNFDAAGSYDFNDHTDLPTPMLGDDHHGTRCAGQIAAGKNDVCGVGIAHGSRVAGVRILSGPISDVDEAAALNYAYQNTSIYSCSWGPPDDGRSMDAPNYLIEKALVNGVNNGRSGKGSVFVFASGNGARWGDQCNFDGYTNSIYSITVAAIDHMDLHPPYSESCAANMVVAYSSGSGKSITTTDLGKDKCTSGHSGTSAAAPNAVGVFALALSVRPDLTWRDMQHLAVRTAVYINPSDPDWEHTAAGRWFSYKYGYGRLDGYAYVQAARAWNLVNPQAWVALPAVQIQGGTMDERGEVSGGARLTREGVLSTVRVSEERMKEANLKAVEHVTVRVWITHGRRGDVEVDLVSPSGVRSVLAAPRELDNHKSGFRGWQFSTIKHWDEDPIGEWTLRVKDQGSPNAQGSFIGWGMTLWGASIDASKATKLAVTPQDSTFPPPERDSVASYTALASASATRTPSRPTDHLPSDHIHATGEAEHPAFTTLTTGAASALGTPATSSQEGGHEELSWADDLSDGVIDQHWFLSALGALIPVLLGVVLFFWLFYMRYSRNRGAEYTIVGDADDATLGMAECGGSSPATFVAEQYHTLGEASDDEDGDESGLRQDNSGVIEFAFQSAFLGQGDGSPASTGR